MKGLEDSTAPERFISEEMIRQDRSIKDACDKAERSLRLVKEQDELIGGLAADVGKIAMEMERQSRRFDGMNKLLVEWGTRVGEYKIHTEGEIQSLRRDLGLVPRIPSVVPSVLPRAGDWDPENSALWDLPPKARQKYQSQKNGKTVAVVAAVASAIVVILQAIGPVITQLAHSRHDPAGRVSSEQPIGGK